MIIIINIEVGVEKKTNKVISSSEKYSKGYSWLCIEYFSRIMYFCGIYKASYEDHVGCHPVWLESKYQSFISHAFIILSGPTNLTVLQDI